MSKRTVGFHGLFGYQVSLMEPKRQNVDRTEETTHLIQRLSALDTPESNQCAEVLLKLMPLLSDVEEEFTKSAGEFTVAEVVHEFGLKYEKYGEQSVWKLEESKLDFPMTPSLKSLLINYDKNFNRSSEAVCRTAIDLILNECMTVLKGNHIDPETKSDRLKTPTPFDNLQIYGEVSFKHKMIVQSESETSQIMNISGRVDYGIGRRFINLKRSSVAEVQRRRRFQCFMIIVEAKIRSAEHTLAQLLVYLACLHQSRLQHNRTDASVYGVATDGYCYTFVTITHSGVVKRSSIFDIKHGNDLLEVLGWLKAVLEITLAMNPNMTPERDGGVEDDGEDLDDPSLGLI